MVVESPKCRSSKSLARLGAQPLHTDLLSIIAETLSNTGNHTQQLEKITMEQYLGLIFFLWIVGASAAVAVLVPAQSR